MLLNPIRSFIQITGRKKFPLILISGLKKSYKFQVGDILHVVYISCNNPYTFNGICMAVRKDFGNPNLSFLLRNVLMGVGIEMVFSYFNNRLFHIFLEFYKKKHLSLHSARIFFIRKRVNSQSRVK